MLSDVSRNHAKSALRTSIRDSNETMSIRKVNYSEIFKNSVYKNLQNRENLPPVSRNKSNVNLPVTARKSHIISDHENLAFPNTDITLDITTSIDK
jgi:hypothetical protein